MKLDHHTIVALLVLAPFIAALLAPLLQRLLKSFAGWALALVPGAMFAQLTTLIGPVAAGETIKVRFEWIPAFDLDLAFWIDGLSLTFALTITGIGALILVYSAAYLKGHAHQGRFLSFLLLFIGAMLGLVLADTMLALYGFWEMTSVTSFLLIGFDSTRQAARRAAIQALVVTGCGGMALLLGVLVLHMMAGGWEMSGLDGGLRGLGAYPLVLGLVVFAAFTKSAQFPFQFWLPNAMEAPTPVSALLHSATMVQAGIYLLARLSPSLGGTPLWTGLLTVMGGITLLWGGIAALRQTDLKLMLAQSTIASLGLLVLMLGLGGELAIMAAMLYFVAHALYKAGLFLVVGVVDHETGSRDITVLGGLADKLPASFIAAAAAALSMFGLPATLGFLAKEELYRALAQGTWQNFALLGVCIIGNALLGGIGLLVAVRPFLGPDKPTPRAPHENSVGLLAGPLLLGGTGLAAAILIGSLGDFVLAPAAGAVLAEPVQSHLGLGIDPASPALWLSVLTWGLAWLVYVEADRVRLRLNRLAGRGRWSFDAVFDALMFGLIRLGAGLTRLLHHGRLEIYLATLFAMLGIALCVPILLSGRLSAWLPGVPDLTVYEWGVLALAVAGILAVPLARTRLVSIITLGVQGLALALIFLLFGAPDLAFTQLMVEILFVVILALVMTRLRLDRQDPREFEDLLRDGSIALLCGGGLTLVLWRLLEAPMQTALSDFFTRTSVALGHGHNIVNVILVDYRGLDTLGEIAVVMTAGIAVLALLRRRPAPAPRQPEAGA